MRTAFMGRRRMFDETMVRPLIAVALLLSVAATVRAQTVLTYTTTGVQSVTLPPCSVQVQVWGAGGNGSSAISGYNSPVGGSWVEAGGGGGGGGLSEWSGNLVGTYYFQVGAGGGSVGGTTTPGTGDSVWDWNGSSGGKEAWATAGGSGSLASCYGGYLASGGAGGVDRNGVYASGGNGGSGGGWESNSFLLRKVILGPATSGWSPQL
jgi:hypothetical protein